MRFGTIVVDPPWNYKSGMYRSNGSGVPGHEMQVERHYSTMTNAEIAALPVGDLAAPDAHVYLWVTNPRLFGERRDRGYSPIDIITGWGFDYKTLLTWHKNTGAPGMGRYFRGDTEHVLFAGRGQCQIAPALRVSNHFGGPRRGHSVKPEEFFRIAERVSPGPRLELFARLPRIGWSVWGNEVESDIRLWASQEPSTGDNR